jgi:hypothetical protein
VWNSVSHIKDRTSDRLSAFENRVLRGNWDNYTMSSFLIRDAHQILFGLSHQEKWDRWASDKYGEETNAYRNLVGKREEDLGVNGRIILNWTWNGMGQRHIHWVNMGQGRKKLECCCEYGNEPSVSIKISETLD